MFPFWTIYIYIIIVLFKILDIGAPKKSVPPHHPASRSPTPLRPSIAIPLTPSRRSTPRSPTSPKSFSSPRRPSVHRQTALDEDLFEDVGLTGELLAGAIRIVDETTKVKSSLFMCLIIVLYTVSLTSVFHFSLCHVFIVFLLNIG